MTHSFANPSFLQALHHQPVARTPVWFMRQAGRYLPEYRELRRQAGSFMQLCKTPELACEATLQPFKRFDLDAAILFSDILTIPDAMGLGLSFTDGEGPKFAQPLHTFADIERLPTLTPQEDLAYVMNTIKLIKRELHQKVPLIGFAGSPWTLACYMVEGGGSKNFHKIKSLMFNHPEALELLLKKLTAAVRLYLQAQINSGVDAVMLFDTWGGILTTADYYRYSLDPMHQIIQSLKTMANTVPTIMFTKHGSQWLEAMANTGVDAVSLDWSIDLFSAKQRVGQQVALQGNMDPAILLSNPPRIREEVRTLLSQYGNDSGHIFNLGHGITPDIPPDNVAACVDAVHEFSQR